MLSLWQRTREPELRGTPNDLRLAIELADEIRRLLSRGDAGGPLLDLESKLPAHGIRVRRSRLLPEKGGPQALLIPRDTDGFDIAVDPTPRRWVEMDSGLHAALLRHRQRFLVAHELAHSLFFDDSAKGLPCRSRPSTAREEEFCDEFARWLLLPHQVVRSEPAEAASVFRLQRAFDVSVQLAARALHEAHGRGPWIAIAVHRVVGGGAEWKLQWTTGSAPVDAVDQVTDRILRDGTASGGSTEGSWIYDDLRHQLVMVGPGEAGRHLAEGPQRVSASCSK
jgi:hypothetical protein